MENNRELAKRFSDVILNNSWVANNSYKNQLTDLPLEVVLFKYQSLHSIAALTMLHHRAEISKRTKQHEVAED